MGPDAGTREPSVLEDVASTTEVTPLIRSGASSPGALSGGGTSSSSEIYRDVEDRDRDRDRDHDPDVPNQRVGPGRALAIVLSVYALIFLQGN